MNKPLKDNGNAETAKVVEVNEYREELLSKLETALESRGTAVTPDSKVAKIIADLMIENSKEQLTKQLEERREQWLHLIKKAQEDEAQELAKAEQAERDKIIASAIFDRNLPAVAGVQAWIDQNKQLSAINLREGIKRDLKVIHEFAEKIRIKLEEAEKSTSSSTSTDAVFEEQANAVSNVVPMLSHLDSVKKDHIAVDEVYENSLKQAKEFALNYDYAPAHKASAFTRIKNWLMKKLGF